jgi:DNA polymerase II large subunit
MGGIPMTVSVALMRKIDGIAPELKEVLWLMLEEIEQQREAAVTKTDFNDLKLIVHELAEAQKRTEQRVEELVEALRETTREIASLSRAHDNTRSQLGGLSRSVAYALENEAYRLLPALLKAHHHIDIDERLVRTWINEEEINFYARARRNGESMVIVGESVMRLDDSSKLEPLEDKLSAVRAVETLPLLPLLVTHFAHPKLLKQAQRQGVLVVQSFEWSS